MTKKLRTCLSSFLLLFISFYADAQIKIGPEAGVNFGMQRSVTKTNSETTNNRSSTLKVGAMAGINVDIKVLKKCYLQTGFFYTYDNIKFKDQVDFTTYNLGNVKRETHDDIHYFRVPLYVMYKSGFDGSGRFLAGFGPYVEYAFIANESSSVPFLNASNTGINYVNTNYQLQLGNKSTDDLKNWDYGLNACIGYESNVGMFFRGYFNWGLQNLIPQGTSENTLHNWGMGVTIGFNIGKDNW